MYEWFVCATINILGWVANQNNKKKFKNITQNKFLPCTNSLSLATVFPLNLPINEQQTIRNSYANDDHNNSSGGRLCSGKFTHLCCHVAYLCLSH